MATHGQLKVAGSKIQDQSNQAVQLKGVSSFWLNWEDPKYAESKAAVQYMRDNWEIQIIRAAMGIEVTNGYLSAKAATQQRVDTIVQNALSLGLYVDRSSKPDVAAANPVVGTNLVYTMHFYACAHAASSRAVGDTAMSKGVALFGDGSRLVAVKEHVGVDSPQIRDVLGGVQAITAGASHTCALMATGGVRCWGDSYFGQLADGSILSTSSPGVVLGICE